MKRQLFWVLAFVTVFPVSTGFAEEVPAVHYGHERVGGILGVLLRISDVILDGWLAFLDWFGSLWAPILIPVFAPLNRLLSAVYQPWAMIVTLGYFLSTMAWVAFILRSSYVNNGRQHVAWYTDLRLWTALSMLPHLFVYVYFR